MKNLFARFWFWLVGWFLPKRVLCLACGVETKETGTVPLCVKCRSMVEKHKRGIRMTRNRTH